MPEWLEFWHLLQTPKRHSLSGIAGPLPDAKAGVLSEKCGSVKESRETGTRNCASPRPARWQRGGQRNQRRKRASTCAEVRTVVSGRQHHRLRVLDDHVVGMGSEEALLERRALRIQAARRNYQTALGTLLKFVQEQPRSLWPRRQNRRSPGCVVERFLCPLSSASPWFTASCCRDGSLAVIQPLWSRKFPRFHGCLKGIATVHTCAHSTSTSLGRHRNTSRPSQSSSYGSVHPHLAGKVTCVRKSFWH